MNSSSICRSVQGIELDGVGLDNITNQLVRYRVVSNSYPCIEPHPRLVSSSSNMSHVPPPPAKPLPSLPPKSPTLLDRISTKLHLRSDSIARNLSLKSSPSTRSKSSEGGGLAKPRVRQGSCRVAFRARYLIPLMKKKTPKEDEYVYSAYNRERALRERGLLPSEEVNEVKGEEGDGVMTEAKRIKEEWKRKMGEENPVSCECNNVLSCESTTQSTSLYQN
jgi:hypothetical protein